jgi:hypothetical protein
MAILQRDAKHCAGQHLRHVSRYFNGLFFRHKLVSFFNIAVLKGEINLFRAKKRVDIWPDSFKFPRIMKSETLNGILTFVLGVLVVVAVILAMKLALLTHESRNLQKEAQFDQAIIVQTQAVYNDAMAYNQKYYDPALSRILQGAMSKPAAR